MTVTVIRGSSRYEYSRPGAPVTIALPGVLKFGLPPPGYGQPHPADFRWNVKTRPTRVYGLVGTGTTAAVAAVALIAAAPAEARDWTVRSPEGNVSAAVRAVGGTVTVTARKGPAVAFRARLSAGRLQRVGVARETREERFATVAGKRRVHVLHARHLRLSLTGGRSVEVLATHDGVAIRERRVAAPRFSAPAGARAHLQRHSGNYERPYRATRLRAARGRYGFPALIDAPSGVWSLLSETGLRPGQGAAHLRARRGTLRVAGADRDPDPGMSPWRFAVVGTLADIVGSSLPTALARPSALRDTSWIRPGRAAWSWWFDSTSPARLETQKQYVDAAAARGWEYVLVDEGWDGGWVPELVRYAAERGVRLILWAHWRDVDEGLLDRLAAWGVAGIKADFLHSDRRRRIAVYRRIARAAARRRLVVNFHGSTLPRGIERTWPNVLTLEAVHGAEHAKAGPIAAAHDVSLVFTRNAVGPMDYTPALTARGSTIGHQLANAVAFESGLQHLADTPDAYAAHPAADALLRALPVAWDDTRLLAGAPGSHATLARRHGDDWWIAHVHAGAATQRTVALDFLPPGQAYRATITGEETSEATVTASDRLTVPVAADGGFVVRLTR